MVLVLRHVLVGVVICILIVSSGTIHIRRYIQQCYTAVFTCIDYMNSTVNTYSSTLQRLASQ
jgi:hypothetical protein